MGHPASDARVDLVGELQRLADVLHDADEAIVSMTNDGVVLSWNRGAQNTFGFESPQMIGSRIELLFAPEFHSELAEWFSEIKRGRRVRREVRAHASGGTSIDVAVTLSPMRDSAGRVDRVSLVARDVTRERWMAGTLETTLHSLETALGVARDSENQSRRFLADAAHQLRTPIAAIRASTESLLQERVPDRRERLLANVLRETSRAARLMNSLLMMARVDEGRPAIRRECDVLTLCRSEIDRVVDVAPDLKVRLDAMRLESSPELDSEIVREILANLLDNARRHAVSTVEVAVDVQDEVVLISVTDDGPGVPEASIPMIFDRFVSLDGHGGSGLGLAIARGLARSHGGDLTYEGQMFVLRLPMAADQMDCGGAARPQRLASRRLAELSRNEVARPRTASTAGQVGSASTTDHP